MRVLRVLLLLSVVLGHRSWGRQRWDRGWRRGWGWIGSWGGCGHSLPRTQLCYASTQIVRFFTGLLVGICCRIFIIVVLLSILRQHPTQLLEGDLLGVRGAAWWVLWIDGLFVQPNLVCLFFWQTSCSPPTRT